MDKKISIFGVGGFPSLNDLESDEWRMLFQRLAREQSDFLAHEVSFRSAEYRWPRDPLHTWSRLWEYPYVFHQVERICQAKADDETVKVADIGSGVTFFPFAIARLDCDVTCIDVDPICERDILAASKIVEYSPGNVAVGIMLDNRIPLPSESQDVVYCISVLEHIPNFEGTIEEIARILKPSGKFVLTVDIDLRGDSELGSEAFTFLQNKLAQKFKSAVPERIIHPAALLTSENSPYPYTQKSIAGLAKRLVKNALKGRLIGGRAGVSLYLTVYATVLEKA